MKPKRKQVKMAVSEMLCRPVLADWNAVHELRDRVQTLRREPALRALHQVRHAEHLCGRAEEGAEEGREAWAIQAQEQGDGVVSSPR